MKVTEGLSTTALWLAVAGMGVYHGINPAMGWPLAVSAGLMGGGQASVWRAFGPIAVGHFLSMALILLPFAFLASIMAWQQSIRIGAGVLIMAAGVYLLINRRHPRFLARIKPSQLGFWSFAVAMAHGAGFMLLPVYLGLCEVADLGQGHAAAAKLMAGNIVMAVGVTGLHTLAMMGAGGLIAFAVYRWLGLQFVTKSWFNLDRLWAASLVLVGALSMAAAYTGH